MREIKFRAWHKERKAWISGRQPDSDDLFVEETDEDDHGYSITHWTETVIMQFTGLSDKNGKEIYEGDILVGEGYPYFDEGERNYVAVVEWCFAGFHYVKYCVNPNKRGISDGINEQLEEGDYFSVIGNIFETPDLLTTKPI